MEINTSWEDLTGESYEPGRFYWKYSGCAMKLQLNNSNGKFSANKCNLTYRQVKLKVILERIDSMNFIYTNKS